MIALAAVATVVVPTQIQLTDQQARRLRALARERGLSLAELVRRCVDKALSKEMPDRGELYDRAARVIRLSRPSGRTRPLEQT